MVNWREINGGIYGANRAVVGSTRLLAGTARFVGTATSWGDRVSYEDNRAAAYAARAEVQEAKARTAAIRANRELSREETYDAGYQAAQQGDGPNTSDYEREGGFRADRARAQGTLAGRGGAADDRDRDETFIDYATPSEVNASIRSFQQIGTARSETASTALAQAYLDDLGAMRNPGDNRIYVSKATPVNGTTIPVGDYSPSEFTQMLGRATNMPKDVENAIVERATVLWPSQAPTSAPSRDGGDRRPVAGAAAAVPAAAPQAPSESLYSLSTGNGNTVAFDSSEFKALSAFDKVTTLVNSTAITNQGNPVSNGERLKVAFDILTVELEAQQPGLSADAINTLAIARFSKDSTIAKNVDALYKESTADERKAILASAGEMTKEIGEVSPELKPGADAMIKELEAAANRTPQQQARDDAAQKARIDALSQITFDNSEAGKKAKDDLALKLQQESKALEGGGGPFGSFFMGLFTMITNILSGKGHLNQSAEELIAENAAVLTEDGKKRFDDVKAGKIAPAASAAAAPASGAAPATEPATADVPSPPPPPSAQQPAAANLGMIVKKEITAWDTLKSDPIVVDKAAIIKAQEQLAGLGYNVGAPDGAAGNKTQAGIKQLETLLGLTADGKLDAKLQAALADPEVVTAIKAAKATGAAQVELAGGPPATPPKPPAPAAGRANG